MGPSHDWSWGKDSSCQPTSHHRAINGRYLKNATRINQSAVHLGWQLWIWMDTSCGFFWIALKCGCIGAKSTWVSENKLKWRYNEFCLRQISVQGYSSIMITTKQTVPIHLPMLAKWSLLTPCSFPQNAHCFSSLASLDMQKWPSYI